LSSDRWFWAQKAHQLRYAQLDIARRQAEAWRNGLAGITTLLSASLVIGGRADVAGLATPYPVVLTALFGAGLAGLVTGTLLAVRAASGAPGDECLLAGEDLERWTAAEVRRVRWAITAASVLTVIAIGAIAIGVGVSWLAPARPLAPSTVRVPPGRILRPPVRSAQERHSPQRPRPTRHRDH
jgi:hypothetical protein